MESMKLIEDIQFLRRLRIGGATIILGGLVICIPILAISDLLGLVLPVFVTLAFAFALWANHQFSSYRCKTCGKKIGSANWKHLAPGATVIFHCPACNTSWSTMTSKPDGDSEDVT